MTYARWARIHFNALTHALRCIPTPRGRRWRYVRTPSATTSPRNGKEKKNRSRQHSQTFSSVTARSSRARTVVVVRARAAVVPPKVLKYHDYPRPRDSLHCTAAAAMPPSWISPVRVARARAVVHDGVVTAVTIFTVRTVRPQTRRIRPPCRPSGIAACPSRRLVPVTVRSKTSPTRPSAEEGAADRGSCTWWVVTCFILHGENVMTKFFRRVTFFFFTGTAPNRRDSSLVRGCWLRQSDLRCPVYYRLYDLMHLPFKICYGSFESTPRITRHGHGLGRVLVFRLAVDC